MSKPTILTHKAFFELDECNCGKKLFRYHNTSKNEFIAKCNTPKEEFDIKTKKWVASKKQPCNFLCAYYGERPIFEDINKTLLKNITNVTKNNTNKDKILEEKLKVLFQFVFISNHTSTLDEINILVKNSLLKEPRKTFYFPSIGYFMRISHYETLEEYRTRIFSKKIVDLSYLKEPFKENNEPIVYYHTRTIPVNLPPIRQSKLFTKVNKQIKPSKQLRPIMKSSKQTKSNFIITSDDDDSDGDGENESDRGSETSRELSDYDTDQNEEVSITGEEIGEEVEEIYEDEKFDDYDDGGDFYVDYD